MKRPPKNRYETCVTSHQNIFFEKLKILSFFKKGGSGGKKIKFLNFSFQIRKGLQKTHMKHVPHSPQIHFSKNLFFLFFLKKGLSYFDY